MSHAGVHKLHVGVVPDLDGLIPRGSDANGGLVSMIEAHAGNGISVSVLVNSVLALSLDVPDLNLVVATSGKDLSVISREGNGEDISGVSNELADSLASGDVPETDSAIPGGREAEATVTSQADLVHKVGVTGEHLLGLSPLDVLLVGGLVVQLPLDEGLVARAREEEFNFLSIDLLFTDGE